MTLPSMSTSRRAGTVSLLLPLCALALQRPATSPVSRVVVGGAYGDSLASKKMAYAVELGPCPAPDPLDFMGPMLVQGASSVLREAGAGAIFVANGDLLATVGDEQRAHAAAHPADGAVAVVYSGAGAAPAGADAFLVRCDAADLAAMAPAVVEAAGAGGAPVLCVEGLATAAACAAAARAALELGAEALVVAGGGDPLANGPPPDEAFAVPLVRGLDFDGDDVDALDAEAHAAGPRGYAGVALLAAPGAAEASPADLSGRLADAMAVLRSKRSRAFAGTWSQVNSALFASEAQEEAVRWGKYMESTTKAGLVEAMNDTPSADPDFDEERGDYVAFDDGSSAGGNDAGHLEGDARQAALDELGERDGWNK